MPACPPYSSELNEDVPSLVDGHRVGPQGIAVARGGLAGRKVEAIGVQRADNLAPADDAVVVMPVTFSRLVLYWGEACNDKMMVESKRILHAKTAHRDKGGGVHIAEVLVSVPFQEVLGRLFPRLEDESTLGQGAVPDTPEKVLGSSIA